MTPATSPAGSSTANGLNQLRLTGSPVEGAVPAAIAENAPQQKPPIATTCSAMSAYCTHAASWMPRTAIAALRAMRPTAIDTVATGFSAMASRPNEASR